MRLVDALRENGVELSRMHESQKFLKAINAKAYLELHIEQGPVLEAASKSAGVVIGTFGVERHLLRFVGQAAHSGSTPIPMRKRRVPGRGRKRAGVPRDRAETHHAAGPRGVHGRHGQGGAGHRHGGSGRV